MDGHCHPWKKLQETIVCLFSSVPERGQVSCSTVKHRQSCRATNTESSTPTLSFERGCKVFVNSFHDDVAAFGAWARACQPPRLLVGNYERPVRQDAVQSVPVWLNKPEMDADEKCFFGHQCDENHIK